MVLSIPGLSVAGMHLQRFGDAAGGPDPISWGTLHAHNIWGGQGPFPVPQPVAGTVWPGDLQDQLCAGWMGQPCPALLHRIEPWKPSSERLL